MSPTWRSRACRPSGLGRASPARAREGSARGRCGLGRRRVGPGCRRAPGRGGLRGHAAPSARPPSARRIHQYQRNLYAQRLYRAGVRIEHHLDLVGTEPGRSSLPQPLCPELETTLAADLLVLALRARPGARPRARIWRPADSASQEAGDCLSPRSAEEAMLEGTLAAARVAVTKIRG